jgi:hypothetical protein
VARYNGTTWLATTGASAGGSNPYVQTRGGITAFSPFGVGSAGALPVKLLDFSAHKAGKDVNVSWITASEENTKLFEVERSYDQITFTEVGTLDAAGTSNNMLSYRLPDKGAFADRSVKVIYYRLKTVDLDGSFSYSSIVRVMSDASAEIKISVFPNPVADGTQLNVNVDLPKEADVYMELTDILGHVMGGKTQVVPEGNNLIMYEGMNDLPAGVYFLNVKVNGVNQITKIVKQ